MKIPKAYIPAAIIVALISIQFAWAATSSTASTTPSAPSFNITSGTLTVCRGQVDDIPIIVTNLGYSPTEAYSQGAPNVSGPQMQQVVLGISAKGIYSGINSNNNNNINPGNSIEIKVPVFVSANVSSLVLAQVSITYNYLYLYTDSETRNITFLTERCPSPLRVNATPGTLISDQTENLTLNLTNSGNTTLSDLLIHIAIPGQDGGVLVNQPIQVNSIMPMSSILLNESINIYGNTNSSFPVNITTTFYNGSNLEQVLNNRFFLATGLIQLIPSSITVSPSPVSPGGIFSMSFVLTDTGTAGATGMEATALPTKGFKVFGSNSIFIGSITSDSQSSVTISQEVANNTKSGVYTIPVRVNYLNNLRQNLSTIVNVSVLVGSASAFNSSAASGYEVRRGSGDISGIIELVMLIIIVALGVLLYRERKRNRRQPK